MIHQITRDQCFCYFGDGNIYEFVSTGDHFYLSNCQNCALYDHHALSKLTDMCYSVPCLKWRRKDKKSGFWRISKAVDYPQFIQMLKKSLNI